MHLSSPVKAFKEMTGYVSSPIRFKTQGNMGKENG